MRVIPGLCLAGGLLLAASVAAQPPGGGGKKEKDTPRGGATAGRDPVARLMAFDADKDGKLTKAEVTDARLHAMFDKADTDNDGSLTKAELTAYATTQGGAAAGGPGRGPGGEGGPGGPMGPGGPGGPGGMGPMGRPQPGQILPTFIADQLKLTDAQKEQVATLQKEVDAKLAKILTAEQLKQMKEVRPGGRGPGGPGGGPGGGPPGGGPGSGPPPEKR